MIATRKLTLAFGIAALLAAPALAQRPGGQGQGQGGPGRFGMGMGGGSLTQLLMAEPVQEALSLSDEQIETLRPMAEQAGNDMRSRFQGLRDLSPEERGERLEAMSREANESARAKLKEVLKPEQMARLEQIHLQQRGLQAFSDPDVVAKLELTDDQKTQLGEVMETFASENRSIMESARDAQDRGAIMGKMMELRRSTMDKVMGMMTDEQKATWTELTGEPVQLGPGGFGGGPGGRPGGRPPVQD